MDGRPRDQLDPVAAVTFDLEGDLAAWGSSELSDAAAVFAKAASLAGPLAEHEEHSGDRDRDDHDVRNVADEPGAVCQEVHDMTLGKPWLAEEPVAGVRGGGSTERTDHDRPPSVLSR